jgi:hypothetical protein
MHASLDKKSAAKLAKASAVSASAPPKKVKGMTQFVKGEDLRNEASTSIIRKKRR